MESPERIWQLIAKMLNDEASSPEQDELFDALQKDPSLYQQYEFLTRIWKEKENDTNDEEDAKQHILKIITRAETETSDQERVTRRRKRRRRFFMAASFLLLTVTTGWLLMPGRAVEKTVENISKETLVAQNGSRTRSLLPDGTTVWLNAGSRLFFVNDFSGNSREVRLEGEAFFDVVKKPEQPFIVHTSGIDIKVLGTAFNVKSYPEDKTVETTLYRGLVQVFREEDAAKTPIELRPNEKLVLSKNAATVPADLSQKSKPVVALPLPRFTIIHIDSTKKENERFETAWLYSRLEFRGNSFEELARKLERWYNVTIVFTDESVKQLSFNGSFEKETVEQAFAALKEANAFSYKINKDEISVGSPE
jgi:transmembrane sensor